MSDNIPFEIQVEIMKMLPVKSLIQFRSVSKPWKSVIDSSTFIINYHVNNIRPKHRLLVRYDDTPGYTNTNKYVSIIDDDTFPENKFFLTDTMPVKLLNKSNIVSSSQGLFCFYRFYPGYINEDVTTRFEYGTATIWNPSVRKSVVISVPNVLTRPYKTVVGFGVCPQTCDPMLVKISYNIHPFISNISWEVEVYTLSSGVWRSPLCSSRPSHSMKLLGNQAVIDTFIYWLAYDIDYADDVERKLYFLILSFDMTTEKFTEVYLKNSLARGFDNDLFISKRRESLVVIEYNFGASSNGVWMMEIGVPNSFTKLFTIKTNIPDGITKKILGFRMSGEPILKMITDLDNDTLIIYEPYSNRINYTGIYGKEFSEMVQSYDETLILLDH